ncbi:MAG: glycosyl hydrolase, partial [Janthinobacterium lividum]
SSWYYDWSANASDKVNDPNAKFIPMIWGQANMNDQDLEAAKKSDSSMLFTFNEPDLPGQSNMTPQQALDNWDKLEATGKKLASPAISNGPDGVKWLDEFMKGAQASGKSVDSISLHWYGSSSSSTQQNLDAMKSYIDQIHEKYPNLPINLTEFGVDPSGNSAGQDPEFLKQAEQMLNGMDYVQMYAPYGLGTPQGNTAA